MKYKEKIKLVANMTQSELESRARELRREIAQGQLQGRAGRSKNLRNSFTLRHELALVLTKLREKL